MSASKLVVLVLWFLLGVLSLDASSLGADAKVIRSGKAATALVDLGRDGSGSAFCIRADGVFLTNQHVVGARSVGEHVTLILNPASDEQKSVEARIMKIGPLRDLALLKVSGVQDLPVVELGSDDDLVETQEVIVFGYPFGRLLSPNGSDAPSISINTGEISALRRRGRELALIQVDAKVNPGNSGGPVLDEGGKVIGVVVSSILGSGVSFAIPVNQVTQFLDEPGIRINSSHVPFRQRFEPYKVDIEVFELQAPSPPLTIKVTAVPPGGASKTVTATAAGDRYSAKVAPLLEGNGKPEYEIYALHNGEVFACETKDVEIRVGRKTFHLEEIVQIEKRPELSIVTTIYRTKYAGEVQGLPQLEDRDTGAAVPLGEAERIEIYAKGGSAAPAQLEVTASRGGKTLARIEHRLEFDAAPYRIGPDTESAVGGRLPWRWRRDAPGRRIYAEFLANDLSNVTWRDVPADRLLADAFVLGAFPEDHNESDVFNHLAKFEVDGDWRGHSLTPRIPREEGTGKFSGPLTAHTCQYDMFLVRTKEECQVSWSAQAYTRYQHNAIEMFVNFVPVATQAESTLSPGVHVFLVRQTHNGTDVFDRSWISLSLFGSGLEVGSMPGTQAAPNELFVSYQDAGSFGVQWRPMENSHPERCLRIGPFPYEFDDQRVLKFLAHGDVHAKLQGNQLTTTKSADEQFQGLSTPKSRVYYVFFIRTKKEQAAKVHFETFWEYQHSWLETFVDFRPFESSRKQMPLRAGEHIIIVCQHQFLSDRPELSWIRFAIEGEGIEVGQVPTLEQER